MRRLAALAASVAFCFGPIAAAQSNPFSETTERALAAGYKALFTCSGYFTAGQTLSEIESNELSGIYVDYRPVMERVDDAVILEAQKTILVGFDGALPPRAAVWRPGIGCSLLPIGASADMTAWLPRFSETGDMQQPDRTTALGDAVTLTDNTFALDLLGIPVSFAFDGSTYGEGTRTSALIVLHKGQVVAEQYARGIDHTTPQRTWSVAKSLTSTIVGAAVHQGILGLDNEAVISDFNKGGDPRRSITLRDVLNMASGLEANTPGSRTDRLYFGGASIVDTLAARSLDAMPGTRFNYSNIDTLIAMRALREALNDDAAYRAFPYQNVLHKIGARHTVLETDWHGDYMSSSQVWMTARDMARLGQLYLQNGMWGGERILPPWWVDFVTKPTSPQPDGDFGYAGSFWLIGGNDGAPRDAYAGLGNRGQHMVIVPSRELVIVRRGFDVAGEPRFEIARLVGDIVGAFDAAERARLAAEAAAELETEGAN
ncbi:MAG: beta-lactamase family protein [Hyphomonadaceae bacterium]|nr:beta-lactamase family protein [Hyphomonadaceae bacterium]